MPISSQAYQRVTNILSPFFNPNLELRTIFKRLKLLNCRPVPSRLEFSVTLSCELPAQMLLSRLLVAVSQVSGGGFEEPEASVLLMIVFVERMWYARLSNVES